MIDPVPLPEAFLRFVSKEHRYFVGDRELPSVTTVLDAVFPFPIFIRKEVIERAGHLGHCVHMACELDDRLELDESTIDDSIRPYLDGWRSFRRHSGFSPDVDGIEVQKHHPVLHYAGTIDRIGRDRRNRRIILNIKSGVRLRHFRIQLAAYVSLLTNPADYIRLCVVLDKSGRFSVEEHPRDFRPDMEMFLSCLNVYNWKLTNNCLPPRRKI